MNKRIFLLLIAILLTLSGCSLSSNNYTTSKNAESETGVESTLPETTVQEITEEESGSVYEAESISESETAATGNEETTAAKIITTITSVLKTTTEKKTDASTTHKKATPKTRISKNGTSENTPEKTSPGSVKAVESPSEGSTKPASTLPSTTKAPVFIPSGEKISAPTTTTAKKPVSTGKKLSFTSTDIDGNPVSMSTYSNSKVIIVNMWEPWCGPCVSEMPDLQKLYNNYKSKGLLIIGVYKTEADAKSTVENNGITYPIVKKTSDFKEYETGYVPTTIIVDGEGNVLTDEPIIGSRSYKEWETLVKPYLE
ncbi:MAG: redoxin domain-containing protein [Clostridia bacterium]|nr:redoxin domain-containing protein [Clostridia bacterium]